ncbi:MAG: RIP metalloprotease RseP [Lachnospiraceae bacterium]|nr:RIP metalloprotease RseP [Lachnospiraceae bacterium]
MNVRCPAIREHTCQAVLCRQAVGPDMDDTLIVIQEGRHNLSIIIFIIILGILLISHEGGHLLVAKMNGIHVVEFMIGMGPKIAQFEKGGTIYSLRVLPIGGACVFEDDVTQEGGQQDKAPESQALEDKNDRPKGKFFNDASLGARFATVVAGPLANIILAFIFSVIIVNFSLTDLPVVVSVMEGYPAEEAGIEAGDTIISVNGERVYLYREVSVISQLNRGKDYTIVVERDGERLTYTFSPLYDEEEGRYYMGITGGEYVQFTGVKALQYGVYEVRYAATSVYKSLLQIIQGQVSSEDVSGVVGVANLVSETYDEVKTYGWLSTLLTMMNLAALLSVNLGIINLLPIPALDGGRILLMAIELVRGKPIPPEKEGVVNTIGFVLLMVLMVFLFFNDIKNIFF